MRGGGPWGCRGLTHPCRRTHRVTALLAAHWLFWVLQRWLRCDSCWSGCPFGSHSNLRCRPTATAGFWRGVGGGKQQRSLSQLAVCLPVLPCASNPTHSPSYTLYRGCAVPLNTLLKGSALVLAAASNVVLMCVCSSAMLCVRLGGVLGVGVGGCIIQTHLCLGASQNSPVCLLLACSSASHLVLSLS